MRSRTLGNLCGLSVAILLASGCAATPPPPSPPPPPPPPAASEDCAAAATILYWVEAGQPKAVVRGNSPFASEEKSLFFAAGQLTPGQSGICWVFVPLDSSSTAQLQWVHIKDFGQQIVTGNGQFDPKSARTNRQTYSQDPPFQSIEYPAGSGQVIDGARVTYKVWIKLIGGAAPFEADPDIVIQKPGG